MENRLNVLEQMVRKSFPAPTVPIYDVDNFPQDAVLGQVAIGTDNSFNWFDGDAWNTQAGVASEWTGVPQDTVEGQIAIGTDGSFHWYVNGAWRTADWQPSVEGNVPQDTVNAQIAIGTDGSFHWFIEDTPSWNTFM